MRLLEVRAFEGCNVYARFPVVQVILDLGELTGRESSEFPQLVCSLQEVLPGLGSHQCSGAAGGFLSRLSTGTYFGHVYEHVALELQNMLGFDVRFGKTRQTATDGVYSVVFEYLLSSIVEPVALLSHSIIMDLLQGEIPDLTAQMAELRDIVREGCLGPSTQAIMDAATKRGISARRIGGQSLIELGTGKYARRFSATIGPNTSCLAADIACDKELTKHLLCAAGVPVPHGLVVKSENSAVEAARSIAGTVVIKPCDGNQGKGVSLGLRDEDEVRKAFRLAAQFSSKVIVEEHIEGKHYRLLTVAHKLVAATERIPASIEGDGYSSVRELIERVNKDPLRGTGHEKPLTIIIEDDLVRDVLSKQSLSMDSVPASGQRVLLRESANLSTGGTARDATDLVHPTIRELSERVSRIIGLDIAGIDLVVPDIALPLAAEGAIIEVNAAPGLRMHLFPTHGQPRDVARPIVDMVFPEGCPTEIPIVAVTGTNGKTTVVRLIAAALRKIYENVALTSSSGVFLNQQELFTGDATGPWSSKLALSQSDVDAAVLEVARGGILREGLGYELADVAVITNISDDHVGQDGIESVEDMAWVKGLVAEAVRKTGWVVVNALDEHCLNIARRTDRSKVLFSSVRNDVIDKHLSLGGRAVYVQEKWLVFREGENIPFAEPIANVPLTFGGKALHNVENCAAAIAALWCLEVPFEIIAQILREFTPGLSANPGRQNILDVKGVRVMVDYAHNTAGLQAVGALARALCQGQLIGVVTAPGDRADKAILDFGYLAANICDVVYFREDEDLRGRLSGEISRLMQQGLQTSDINTEHFVHLNEADAISAALERAQTGDIVLILYENLERTLTILRTIDSQVHHTEVVAGE